MRSAIRRRLIFMSLSLILPVVSISCGGGTGTAAGGGTGSSSVGPVAGFGSVIVNGVRYDDTAIDGATFFDDHGRTKADLKTGMMVAVFGSINGSNGRADNIAILRHVDGPMDDNGVNLSTNGLKVMGQDVVVDASTAYDNGITGIADLQTLQGANARHPELEVHGSADNNGAIHATFIHKWADDRVAGRDVQVRGTVTGLDTASGTFHIGRATVDYNALGSLPAGVGNGAFAEAKGAIRASDNVLVAAFVKAEDATAGQSSGNRTEVEGYVGRVATPNASFELTGPNGVQTVTWTPGTTAFTGGTGADILGGVKVEVEGTRKSGGVLAATRIAIRRASNVLMESTATSVASSSLTILGKTVTVNALTLYKDSSGVDLRTFGQASILVGDSLTVSAFLDNSTVPASIVATRVERTDAIGPAGHILQGPLDTALSPSLSILGITVVTLPVPGTTFLRADGSAFPAQADFFAAVGIGDIVNARGNQAAPTVIMNASEVRIEPKIAN